MLNTIFLNGGGKVKKGQGGVIDDGYIRFKDPEVLRVLLANGVDTDGDGGITEEEAAAVTSIGAWFDKNSNITSFNEFKHFTNVTLLKDSSNSNVNGTCAFSKCTSLQEITLPSSLTRIGSFAFSNCTSLEKINIDEHITYIGFRAFENCVNINIELFMPNLTNIGDWAFYNSGVSGELNLPKLESIANRSFKNTKITKILSLGKITELGKYVNWNSNGYGVFSGCIQLTSVVLPTSLTLVGNYAFSGCTELEEMDWTNSIEIVQDYAFHNCSKWNAVATITNLTSIGSLAFYNTPNTTFVIDCPNLTGTIGMNAFYNSGVVRVENLGTITGFVKNNNYSWANGFHGSKKLEFVRLPNTIESIIPECFVDCTSLQALICEATTPPTLASTNAFNNTNNCPIYIPDESVTAYREASGWLDYADRIKPLSEYTE